MGLRAIPTFSPVIDFSDLRRKGLLTPFLGSISGNDFNYGN
jgi:hypothetical protein